MSVHSSILAWEIPWTEEPGRLVPRVTESWTQLIDRTHTHTHTLCTQVLGLEAEPQRPKKL